jgi:hypothetical protein
MYNVPKTTQEVETAISALKINANIDAYLATDREDAKAKVLSMIPLDKSVMTMTSVTLDTLGIAEEINNSGKYKTVRGEFAKLDPNTDATRMKELGAAPEYTVGSVHAVTMDGKVIIASNTGSQLPAYAYAAGHVIWVVGTQKIVRDLEDGMKRIHDYTLPLESERAKKAYGAPGSSINKLLIVNKENIEGRITIIFVPENIGF